MGIYQTHSAYQPQQTAIKSRPPKPAPSGLKSRTVFNENTGKLEVTFVSENTPLRKINKKKKKPKMICDFESPTDAGSKPKRKKKGKKKRGRFKPARLY